MFDDSLNLFDLSCRWANGYQLWGGTVFILAGCLTIVMGLLFYCGICNDEYAINEGLRREVSNT